MLAMLTACVTVQTEVYIKNYYMLDQHKMRLQFPDPLSGYDCGVCGHAAAEQGKKPELGAARRREGTAANPLQIWICQPGLTPPPPPSLSHLHPHLVKR